MMTSGWKSRISVTCRSVMPPETGHHGAAEPLGAVVRAEAAGEQAVPVGDVHDVAGAAAGRADGAGHDGGPGVDVRGGVADDGGAAGGARRGVHPRHLLAGHREHAERVVVAQRRLRRERELGEVGQVLDVVGVDRRRRRTSSGSTARSRRRAAATSAAAQAAAPAARQPRRSRWAQARPAGLTAAVMAVLLRRRSQR